MYFVCTPSSILQQVYMYINIQWKLLDLALWYLRKLYDLKVRFFTWKAGVVYISTIYVQNWSAYLIKNFHVDTVYTMRKISMKEVHVKMYIDV